MFTVSVRLLYTSSLDLEQCSMQMQPFVEILLKINAYGSSKMEKKKITNCSQYRPLPKAGVVLFFIIENDEPIINHTISSLRRS